jgi:general secretion pathway protein B
MSFILDALKKSEAERQRQHAPGIAGIPESGRQGGSRKWLWILSALLVVNLAVLAGILLRPGGDNAAAVADAQQPSPRPSVAEQAARPLPQATTVQQATAEPQTQREQAAAQAGVADTPTPASSPRTATPSAPEQRVATGLPSLNELQAQGVLQLPEMHLDIHVYSGQPAERFVFVNMKKYTEGATLSEGPAVHEITQDGVVLDYLGTQFLLPRE